MRYWLISSDLLRCALGESIRVDHDLTPELWPTKVDPSQVRDALLNLAINARDAMPGGGQLTIATVNAELDEAAAKEFGISEGCYVELSVADIGIGMAPDVLRRALEPFFTTKPPGVGTGLGLSTVYGFASQSGGTLAIRSTPGAGTTVRLLLPRAAGLLPARRKRRFRFHRRMGEEEYCWWMTTPRCGLSLPANSPRLATRSRRRKVVRPRSLCCGAGRASICCLRMR